MSNDDSAFNQPVSPVGEQVETSLSQLLGLSKGDSTLAQLHDELDEIRDNEREAEKAVANIRLN